MTTDQISELKIPSADNAVLFLWATFPQLEEALKVIKAWGFKYKTCGFTWVKTNKDGSLFMGMGRHTRANAEICLLATKGKGVKRMRADIRNTILLPRTKHSEKPPQFRNSIVNLYGELPRIELFARQKIEGWDSWGNEVENDIDLTPPESSKEI